MKNYQKTYISWHTRKMCNFLKHEMNNDLIKSTKIQNWKIEYINWKIDGTVPTYWFTRTLYSSTFLVSVPSSLTWRYLKQVPEFVPTKVTLEGASIGLPGINTWKNKEMVGHRKILEMVWGTPNVLSNLQISTYPYHPCMVYLRWILW